MDLTDEQYSILAGRMVEEHRKYGDHLRPGHWADVAARKVVSHINDFTEKRGDMDLKKVTRIEVIDETGRGYVNTQAGRAEAQLQDDGRTLKIFTSGSSKQPPSPGLSVDEVMVECQKCYVDGLSGKRGWSVYKEDLRARLNELIQSKK